MHHGFKHTASSLKLSAEAVAMARQLAEPDGNVVFEGHPLRNTPDNWIVGVSDAKSAKDGWFKVDPYRQLLAYGLAEIIKRDKPHIEADPWTRARREFWWAIVITERGRAWLADGAPRTIQPPAYNPGRRARAA